MESYSRGRSPDGPYGALERSRHHIAHILPRLFCIVSEEIETLVGLLLSERASSHSPMQSHQLGQQIAIARLRLHVWSSVDSMLVDIRPVLLGHC